MQAITALAHLRAAVLYVMDISEQCGHSLEAQLELFQNIKPLFANKVGWVFIASAKPILIVTTSELILVLHVWFPHPSLALSL